MYMDYMYMYMDYMYLYMDYMYMDMDPTYSCFGCILMSTNFLADGMPIKKSITQ